jgi:hypothetical protein
VTPLLAKHDNAKPYLHKCHSDEATIPPQATSLLLKTLRGIRSFDSQEGIQMLCGLHTFFFLTFRDCTEEILENFLLGRNPPSQQCVCSSVGVILQESHCWGPRLGMCFYSQDCKFLPCSNDCHFPGTDRNLAKVEWRKVDMSSA